MSEALCDPVAEKTVIGAVLIHPISLGQVGKLAAEDFHDMKHSAIWAAIRDLDLQEKPIDLITVAAAMQASGTFDTLAACGGAEYLTTVCSSIVTIENIDYHAKRLRSLARRRAWHRFAQRMVVESADSGVEVEDFIDGAERAAAELQAREEERRGPQSMYSMLRDTVKDMERRSDMPGVQTGVTGIATGQCKFDRMTSGLQSAELVLLAGRPGMGKTAELLNWLAFAANNGEPALLMSLEMRDRVQIERMLSRHSRVNAQAIRRGSLLPEEWMALRASASKMSAWGLEIDDARGIGLAEIKATARQWRARTAKRFPGRKGILAVDHIGLVAGPRGSSKWEPNRAREISEIALGLRNLSSELDVAVVALCQLNRGVESRSDKRPIPSDLKESGSLEEHADTIAFMYREFVYSKKQEDADTAELIISKQRNGPTGTVDLRWDGSLQTFSDAPEDAAPAPKPRASKPRTNGFRHPHAPPEDD